MKMTRTLFRTSLRGRALFESGFGVTDVDERQQKGWIFRKTTLSDEFSFEDAQAKMPDRAHMLLIIRASGTMRFFTHAVRPEPRVWRHHHYFLAAAERKDAGKCQPRTATNRRHARKPQPHDMQEIHSILFAATLAVSFLRYACSPASETLPFLTGRQTAVEDERYRARRHIHRSR